MRKGNDPRTWDRFESSEQNPAGDTGYDAFCSGAERSENPYPEETEYWHKWNEGWDEAFDDLARSS